MAVTHYLYGNFPHLAFEGGFGNLLTNTIKVALCTSSYTPSQENHDAYDDLTNEVANGNGYTTGGATLASKTCTYASKVTTFDAANVSWTSSTITARYAVIYYASGTASTSYLITYIDFGTDMASSASTFTLAFNASGIFTFTVA